MQSRRIGQQCSRLSANRGSGARYNPCEIRLGLGRRLNQPAAGAHCGVEFVLRRRERFLRGAHLGRKQDVCLIRGVQRVEFGLSRGNRNGGQRHGVSRALESGRLFGVRGVQRDQRL